MHGLGTLQSMNAPSARPRPHKATWKRTDGRRPSPALIENIARPSARPVPARTASDIRLERQRQHIMHSAGLAAGRNEGRLSSLGVVQRHRKHASDPAAAEALARVEAELLAAVRLW